MTLHLVCLNKNGKLAGSLERVPQNICVENVILINITSSFYESII